MMGCERDVSTSCRGVVLGMLRRCLHLLLLTKVVIEAGNSTNATPYLLFTTQHTVFRHYLHDNAMTEEVLTPSSLGILGLSYHLKLDSIFWANSHFLRPAIMTARLNGSDERVIVAGDLGDLADLAVDWLNDRLYWVDRDLREIGEYDLRTGHRSVVLSTGGPGTSSPATLALYPYPSYGWIYWSDGNKLEKASVTGDDRSVLRTNLLCVEVLTIDYSSFTMYWIDHCLYEIQSLRLDGDEATHSFPFDANIFFASGLVIYNGTFFWAEQNGVFERANTEGAMVRTVYSVAFGSRCTGLQLVHPSTQPQVEEYIDTITATNGTFLFQCSTECVNGKCIPPGLCACDAGWRGKSCDIDVNECERQNGGCGYQCSNTVGSYHCSCPVGYILAEDGLAEDGLVCEAIMASSTGIDPSTAVPDILQSSSPQSIMKNYNSTTSAAVKSYSTSTNSDSSTLLVAMTLPAIPSSVSSDHYGADSSTTKMTESTFTQSVVMLASPATTELTKVLVPTLFQSTTGGDAATLSQHSEYTTNSISMPVLSTKTVAHLSTTETQHRTTISSHETMSSSGDGKPSSQSTQLHVSPTSTFEPPHVDIELPGEVEVAATSRDEVSVIVAVSAVVSCLIAASGVLLVAILVVYRARRKQHRTGSYSPDHHHEPMKLNMSVTRLSNNFSYT